MKKVKKKEQKKAFTLIELLVTITIIGIIALMALPALSKMQSVNLERKFEAYGKSVLIAGKLYNNSYDDDLFGRIDSGCVDVPYLDIKGKKLIDDIQIANTNCNANTLTKVRIRKAFKKYRYELFMKCTKDNVEVYKTKNLNAGTSNCELSPQGDQEAPDVKLSTKLTTSTGSVETNETSTYKIEDKSKLNVVFSIEDAGSGVAENNYIHYIWKFNNTAITSSTKANITVNASDFGKGKATLTVPNDIATKNKKGTFTIEVTTTNVKDNANNQVPATKVIKKSIKIDNTVEEPVIAIATPSVTYKVTKDGTTSNYTNDTWTRGYVTATASCTTSGIDHYEFLETASNSVVKTNPYKITANGTFKIKVRACTNKGCSPYSSVETIKIDNKAPSDPTVSLYKWKTTTAPTSTSGLSPYPNNTWFSGKVYTVASGSTDEHSGGVYYRYTTTGTTTNNTDAKASTRNIEAQGVSYIKYKACDKLDNCTGYTGNYTIKLDRGNPSKPTVHLYKWKNNSTTPTSSSGLKAYSNNTWLSGKVFTKPSGSTDTYSSITYQYTTTGATTNNKNQPGTYRNIEAEGTSYIKWRACDAAGNCSDYTGNSTIKLDRTAPTVEKYKTSVKSGWTHFYIYFKDTAGLNTVNKSHKTDGKMYYCYNGKPGGCSNICTNSPKVGSRTKIGSKHYDVAKIDSNLQSKSIDTVEIKTSNGCAGGKKYTVYIVVYACDLLNNCAWRAKSSPFALNANQGSKWKNL